MPRSRAERVVSWRSSFSPMSVAPAREASTPKDCAHQACTCQRTCESATMSAIDVIRRRLKEERIPDVPEDAGEKKKRPREVAFMDVNLCFPCGKCPEFCPVQCIEYLAPGSVPGRGVQPVQDRFQECIG